MAEVQLSEPLVDENFTDRGWRAAFAGRTGVIGDADGSSFGLTLPAEGATAQLGSATQPSRLVVDGYGLEVAQGTTQSLDIPASSGGGTNGRTDLIVARLNLSSFTTAPGPVRLARVPGTEGSLSVPAATYDQDGIRDLPLYAVRRRQGESLNQAIVTDMRPRLAYNYDVPVGSPLPIGVPLGSRASRGDTFWRFDGVGSSVDWIQERPTEVLTGTAAVQGVSPWARNAECRMARDGDHRSAHIFLTKGGAALESGEAGEVDSPIVAKLNDDDKPPAGVAIAAAAYAISPSGSFWNAGARIGADGNVRITSLVPFTLTRSIVISATWSRA